MLKRRFKPDNVTFMFDYRFARAIDRYMVLDAKYNDDLDACVFIGFNRLTSGDIHDIFWDACAIRVKELGLEEVGYVKAAK